MRAETRVAAMKTAETKDVATIIEAEIMGAGMKVEVAKVAITSYISVVSIFLSVLRLKNVG